MTQSPASIVSAILIAANVGIKSSLGANTLPWQVTYGRIPIAPIRVIGVMDSVPVTDGRDNRTGETIQHPGIQVSVRSDDYDEGWAKIRAAKVCLDAVRRQTVTIKGVSFLVHAFKLTSGPMFIGVDEKANASNFTANWTITVTQEG